MSERDLFANFARMRREMDEMLSGTWGRATYISRRSSGFSPNVDVYYSGDPQRAVGLVGALHEVPRGGARAGALEDLLARAHEVVVAARQALGLDQPVAGR